MKVGDKVVCIDAKDQRVGDIKAPIPVIKGKEYLITEIINYGYGLNVKGATAVYKEYGFDITRFRKLETYTSKVSDVKFKEIKEGLDIQVPQLV